MNFSVLIAVLTDLGFSCPRALGERSPAKHLLHEKVTVRPARGHVICPPSINVAPEKAKDEELPNASLFFEVYFQRHRDGSIGFASQKVIKIQTAGWVEEIRTWLPVAIERAKVRDSEESSYEARCKIFQDSIEQMRAKIKAEFPNLPVKILNDGDKACGISTTLQVMGTAEEIIAKLHVINLIEAK